MIIDIHVHPGYAQDLKSLREEFRPALRASEHHGVAWLCVNTIADWTSSPTPARVRKGNDVVAALMSDHPDRVLGFCYLNPRYPDEALREIDRCVVQGGMAGIKLWQACTADDERVDPIARRAAELGIPILQHAWYKAGGNSPNESTPAQVAALAARNPETMIVMAHLTGGGERGISAIAPYDNLHVDTSGGEPEAGLIELAVRRLGARRVVFGTDNPIRSYGMTLGKVQDARITARQRDQILCGNARRLLGQRLAR